MSTSVYKPIGMLARTTERLGCCPSVRKVRKALFEPVDHVATQKFLDEELAKIRTRESEKWNFNFMTEEVLDPQGVFEWRPATPHKHIRPIKRKFEEEFDCVQLYAQPGELEMDAEIVKPKAIKLESTVQIHQAQRLITDFMPVKKSSTSETKKKCDWNANRSAKVPRMAEFRR